MTNSIKSLFDQLPSFYLTKENITHNKFKKFGYFYNEQNYIFESDIIK